MKACWRPSPPLPTTKSSRGINEGRIKGLWILCTNPRHSWTNNETFASAVKKLELFVVQDIYDSIESAEECTVFFPVVPGIKKEGTYINLERRLSAMRPCLPRGEHEISDYEAILGVGRALGMGDMLKGWETPRDCFGLMKECSRGMPCDITGVTWEGLENSRGIQWPLREGESPKEDERRLYEDGKFFTPSGKAQFQVQICR
ncbi:MAG: molybdopterin-dependent oxidoreductase [Enterocloster bolteae]